MSHNTLPPYVAKYFWGDNLTELNIHKHHDYIIQTLLNLGDQKAINWLFSTVQKEDIKKTIPSLKLDKKSANFWKLCL